MPNAAASVQLHEIAKALKGAADPVSARSVRVAMLRGLKSAAKPMTEAARQSARDSLPRHGGLNERVAGASFAVSVRTSPRTAGVRITAKDSTPTSHDVSATNSGYVRHPVYGHNRWVRQPLPNAAGWWDKAMESQQDQATGELLKVLEETAAAIQAGI